MPCESLQWGRDLSVAEGASYASSSAFMRALQWGRDLSVAEGVQTTSKDMSDLLLQWGRDLSVAEGPAPGGLPSLASGFNGAATFRSRKALNDSV